MTLLDFIGELQLPCPAFYTDTYIEIGCWRIGGQELEGYFYLTGKMEIFYSDRCGLEPDQEWFIRSGEDIPDSLREKALIFSTK